MKYKNAEKKLFKKGFIIKSIMKNPDNNYSIIFSKGDYRIAFDSNSELCISSFYFYKRVDDKSYLPSAKMIVESKTLSQALKALKRLENEELENFIKSYI